VVIIFGILNSPISDSFRNISFGTLLQTCCATSLVRFQVESLEFFIDKKSFQPHYGPGVHSASNTNEYQEHFLGVKAAGAYG